VERLVGGGLPSPRNLRTTYREVNDEFMLERFDPVVDISPLIGRLTHDQRILELMRMVLEDDNPLLFKDKLILKPPGMSGYAVHQDQAWWQLCPGTDVATAFIALDEAPLRSGCLALYPGAYQTLIAGSEFRNLHSDEVDELGPPYMLAMEPGDVVAFNAMVPHGSGTNESVGSRAAIALSFSASRWGSLYEAQRCQYLAMKRSELTTEEWLRMYLR
jgi:ectoine hydroxylase-related dioxygenase (phytanoyl-CoA dioxygenase family)